MDFAITILLGFLAGLLPYAGLSRRVWNLQCDLKSTQVQLLKDRNTRAADVRWRDKELLEELKKAAPGMPPPPPGPRDLMAKFKRV